MIRRLSTGPDTLVCGGPDAMEYGFRLRTLEWTDTTQPRTTAPARFHWCDYRKGFKWTYTAQVLRVRRSPYAS